jgi:hypothetical protein
MIRLRHPIRAIREPFGTAGLIVAVVALVAAIGGTALAAAKLNSTQKKEVEKIAKKYAGKAGTNGTNGAPGANGKDGANGTNGAPGAPGTEGKSVEAESASVAKCAEGGTVFKIAGVEKGKACNGIEGDPGPQGEPWTAGGTLPPGAVETGTWVAGGPGLSSSPLTFTIPLPARVQAESIHFGTGRERKEEEIKTGLPAPETEFEEQCGSLTRTTPIEPVEAPNSELAGNLCVFFNEASFRHATSKLVTRKGPDIEGAGPSGGYLQIVNDENFNLYGSYAVRGCSTALPGGDPNKCP